MAEPRVAMQRFREEAKLTVEQAGTRAGFKSKSGWANIETGRQDPSFRGLFAIAGVFGVAPTDVFPELAERVKSKDA